MNSPYRMLGRDVIERLLPHRSPFVMVDRVVRFSIGSAPSLTAERAILSRDPVFASGLEAWPSVYVIEGLGQCSNLLTVIQIASQRLKGEGWEDERVTQAFAELGESNRLREILSAASSFEKLGMLASVDVEIIDRVAAGDVLRYEVALSRVVRELSRFDVEAFVGKRKVAGGTLVGARTEGVA